MNTEFDWHFLAVVDEGTYSYMFRAPTLADAMATFNEQYSRMEWFEWMRALYIKRESNSEE